MTHSMSNRNTFTAEKCLPRILLLRPPTGQGAFRQHTAQTVMSPFSSDMEPSQCRLFFFLMIILSIHLNRQFFYTRSHEIVYNLSHSIMLCFRVTEGTSVSLILSVQISLFYFFFIRLEASVTSLALSVTEQLSKASM